MQVSNEALPTERQNELYQIHENLVERVVRCLLQNRPSVLQRTEYDDLMQDGRHGLTLATRSFDPGHGAKFTTWAEYCIKNEIRNGLKTLGLHVELVSFDENHAESTPDNADPAAQAEAKVLCVEILDQLSAGQRAALKNATPVKLSRAIIITKVHHSFASGGLLFVASNF